MPHTAPSSPSPRRSHVVRGAAAAVVAALALVALVAAPARAAVPVPAAPAYSSAIDAYPRYEAESTCSPTEKPGVQVVRDLLRATYGTSISSNIVRPCTASSSGHEEGRALDWMTNVRVAAQRDIANTFLAWLQASDSWGNPHAMARRMGIQYVIWNNRMWRTYDPGRGWTEYSGCLAAAKAGTAYDTTCHRNHVHLSFSWDGALERTSYYTGRAACPVPSTPATFTAALPTGLGAVAVTPARLADTRAGTAACRVGANARYDVQVTGKGGVPTTGVGAALLNLTAIGPRGSTWLGAYPAGTAFPGTSSVNVPAGGTAAALVVVPVGSGGKVSIHNGSSPVDVAVDVVGYYATGGAGAAHTPIAPQRAMDSRSTAAFAAGEKRTLRLGGRAGVPSNAVAVLVNVTETGSAKPGYLSVAPTLTGTPKTSTLNYAAGDTLANRAFVALSGTGSVDVYSSSGGHVVVDVVGWFGPGGSGLRFSALRPARVLDTRNGTGGLDPLRAGVPETFPVAGTGGVPLDAKGVVGTLTAVRPTRGSYVTAWPGGPVPLTSDINVPTGGTRANLLSSKVDQGAVALTVSAGTIDVVLDVLGYYR